MFNYRQEIKRKINNLKLETKLLLSTICINIVFVVFFLFIAFHLVESRYDKLLYQSTKTSSALVAHEFSNRLEDMVTMSNIVRSDGTVQTILDDLANAEQNFGKHYYSEIGSVLQRHYLEYKQNYIKFAAVYCPDFTAYTYANMEERLSAEERIKLVALAEEGSGSAVWVKDETDPSALFLVREIKKIENLRLDNLGTFLLKVNLDKLVEEVSEISKEHEDCRWMIYDGEETVYISPTLSQEAVDKVENKIQDYGVVKLDGKKYFAIRGNMEINDWEFCHLVSYEEVARTRVVTLLLYIVIILLGFLCSFYLMHMVVRRTTRHIDYLVLRMKEFGSNSETLPESVYDYSARMDEIGMLHRQFGSMAEQIQTLVVENYRQQLLAKDAQLKSLEAQMNPHFLYNTLDSINWRAKAIGEPQIAQIAGSLGHFLRMTLNKKSDSFSLREEMDVIQYYMTIQQLRFDNRLNFAMNVPESYRDARVPKLCLQPLVENAVYYALEEVAEDCYIGVTCTKIGDNLQIYVKNTGSEFPDNLLEKLRNQEVKEKGLGIALLNIQERIQLMFGKQYGLQFYNEQEYAVVKVEIPYVSVQKGENHAKDDYCG